MAVTENLYAILDADQSLFGWRQLIPAWQKISSDSLCMRAGKWTTRHESLAKEIVCAGGFSVTQGMRDSMQLLAHGALGSSIGFRGLHL